MATVDKDLRNAAKLAKAFKETLEKFGINIQQLCDIILDHEWRLQELERPQDTKTELSYLKTYIENIEDSEKRNAALAELAALCNVLGELIWRLNCGGSEHAFKG